MPSIDLIARHRNPLEAVRRAAAKAASDEAWFQIAIIESIDMGLETPASREMAREWLARLRDVAHGRESITSR
jgi:hypothetical protein